MRQLVLSEESRSPQELTMTEVTFLVESFLSESAGKKLACYTDRSLGGQESIVYKIRKPQERSIGVCVDLQRGNDFEHPIPLFNQWMRRRTGHVKDLYLQKYARDLPSETLRILERNIEMIMEHLSEEIKRCNLHLFEIETTERVDRVLVARRRSRDIKKVESGSGRPINYFKDSFYK